MINSFKQYLVEADKQIYFTFGRMNPPTIGHEKLMDKLAQSAGRNPYKVFVSQSQDSNKNPLSYSDKIKFARKMFPKHARNILINKKIKTVFDAAVSLYDQGYNKVNMVVGSDRVNEFEILLNKYNGVKGRHGFYNFETFRVISAGDRDPDSEGVSGMSASKMRAAAADNDFAHFGQGLPKGVSNSDAKALFNAVRKGMGIKEQSTFKNHIELKKVSDMREQYVQGNLFELGDEVVIKKTGQKGKISWLGSNYLVVEMNGKTSRHWLEAVQKPTPVDVAKDKINKEKQADKKRFDRMMDRARSQHTSNLNKRVEGKNHSWKTTGHYTKDGEEWKGDQHAHDGQVMTGKKHTDDSQNLYHFKDLPKAIQNKLLKKMDIKAEGLKDPKDNPCWPGYKPVGTKTKNGKVVPNCVPVESKISKLKELRKRK